jgi:hypothetical protein
VALGQVFLRVLRFSPAIIIPPLLHIRLSPPHEVCDSSDQAAHCHHLGPKLGASFLTRHFGWKQNKKVKNKQTLAHCQRIYPCPQADTYLAGERVRSSARHVLDAYSLLVICGSFVVTVFGARDQMEGRPSSYYCTYVFGVSAAQGNVCVHWHLFGIFQYWQRTASNPSNFLRMYLMSLTQKWAVSLDILLALHFRF